VLLFIIAVLAGLLWASFCDSLWGERDRDLSFWILLCVGAFFLGLTLSVASPLFSS
jgi:hypothetical protein